MTEYIYDKSVNFMFKYRSGSMEAPQLSRKNQFVCILGNKFELNFETLGEHKSLSIPNKKTMFQSERREDQQNSNRQES